MKSRWTTTCCGHACAHLLNHKVWGLIFIFVIDSFFYSQVGGLMTAFSLLENSFLMQLQHLHTPWLDSFMAALSTLGNGGMLWILLGALLLLKKSTRMTGLMLLLSMGLGAIIGNLALKNLIARSRPCWVHPQVPLLIPVPKDYSFPSGHTLSSFAAATALFLHHKKSGIAAYAVALLMGFSRLYLYVHYPTDVLAGAFLGIFCALLINRIWPAVLQRFPGLQNPL